MSKIIDVIDNLEDLLALKPATDEEIENVEIELALQLSDEYKEYLRKYGAILAMDIELTGIAKAKHRDVVQVTKKNGQQIVRCLISFMWLRMLLLMV